MINIEGLNKPDVLAGLYNNSKVQGLGFLHFDPKPMTKDEAEALLARQTYFDYLFGRVLKINLSSDIEFEEGAYDFDNGKGSASLVVETIRNI